MLKMREEKENIKTENMIYYRRPLAVIMNKFALSGILAFLEEISGVMLNLLDQER